VGNTPAFQLKFKDAIEQQTVTIQRWTAELEETMKTLAKDCVRRFDASP
jgi:hypothetical protein